MTTRTRAPKVTRTKKITSMARVFSRNLTDLAELSVKCEQHYGGSFAQQHTIEKAIIALREKFEALEKELAQPSPLPHHGKSVN